MSTTDVSVFSTVLADGAVVLTAALAAAVNSVAGGGTFLSFPALTGFAHLSEKAANMTSTVGLWPGSAASIAAARAEFKTIPKGMLVSFSIISLLGGAAGALLLIQTNPLTFKLVIPWLLAFATIIFAFSRPIARWAGRKHGERSLKWSILIGLVQVAIALYGGYFGAGIGVLMLAGLSFTGLDHIHQMNALKVLLATFINGIATIIFIVSSLGAPATDRVQWTVAAGMIVASAFGGFFGMRLSRPKNPTGASAAGDIAHWNHIDIDLLLAGIWSRAMSHKQLAYRPLFPGSLRPPPGERWIQRFATRLWFCIGIFAAVLFALQVRSWWSPTPDVTGYFSIARSVWSGEGLSNLGNRVLHYAPGYPLLISPAVVFGDRAFLLISLMSNT